MKNINLIPNPLNCNYTEGELLLSECLAYTVPEAFKSECSVFAEQISNLIPCKENEKGILVLTEDKSIKKEEGYTLEITKEKIRICASGKAGAYYALQTIRQILLTAEKKNSAFCIPCLSIIDEPKYEWRGIMLDTVRNFFSIKFIKKIIDSASFHKLNRFQWHLTDDQGWRFPVPKYPKLTEIGSVQPDPRHQERDFQIKKDQFYTYEQIKDVIEYAQKRHVLVVPEIETPGHASAILASYPKLGCTGGPYGVEGRYGIFDDVLCAGNDKVLEVLDEIIKNVSEVFPGPYIHIGGDECPKVRWDECPKCKQRMKDNGFTSSAQLQPWMTSKVTAMVHKYGKTPIGWDEVLDDAEKIELPQDLIVMSWRGTEGGLKAGKLGHKVVMTPTTEGCYLDYPHLEDGEEPGLQSCTTVKKSYDYSPVPENYPHEKEENVLGGQGNVWSELLYSSRWAEYMIFPRLCALSEALWLPKNKKDFDSFAERLPEHKKRLDSLDLQYYKGPLF